MGAESAFTRFFLESERLEASYQALQEKLEEVEETVQTSETRMAGKLAELEFVTGYLTAILNRMSQGIVFVDLNGVVTTCNPASEKMLGVLAEEVLFQPFTHLFGDEIFGFSILHVLREKQEPLPRLVSLKNKQGQLVDLEVEALCVSTPLVYSAVGLGMDNKPIQGLLILMRNVTEERLLQEASQRFNRLKDIGELAAHLAHEIRNPLAGIRGFASLLAEDLRESEDQAKMAVSIVEGADQLNQLVSNILSYTRPFQIHLEWIDLVHLVEGLRPYIEADRAWHPGISIEIKAACEKIDCFLDPSLIKSALLNLAVNALQAMPDGGVLKIEMRMFDEEIGIEVADTGKGISKEHLAHLFSPFFTTKSEGTGLGLAEVQKVIQAHRGKIEVDSKEGLGSSFFIKIPFRK